MAKTKPPSMPADLSDSAKQYAARKQRSAKKQAEQSREGRDIAPLPVVVNPRRKARCRKSLQWFCEEYFAGRFPLKWSEPHLRAIDRMERCVIDGGLYALAMPRGSGKTTIAECAAIWAVVYGFRRFVLVIGATEKHAGNMLDSIKAEVESNDILAEDFPEVCYPVKRLEGIHHRANGQTLNGARTRIRWTQGEVILPTIPETESSGAIIGAVGLTGAIRGMRITGADGKPKRPDLVIPDDPQTDESARSPSQCHARENLITKAVLGLAGPKRKIAVVMPCTVIERGDLAERLLDRDRNPEWQGERTKFLLSRPTNQQLWDQYASIRNDSLRAGHEGREATEFYAANRLAMDAGAQVSWPERFNTDELSGIQHAMNLMIRSRRAFMAEYQNEPEADAVIGVKELIAGAIAAKINQVPRHQVPRECTRLTSFIDCGGRIHWYLILATDERFNLSVIDYGTYPRQTRSYFDASDPRPGMNDLEGWGNHSEPQRVYAGVRALADEILGREYARHGTGEAIRIARCLVDAGDWPEAVQLACRQSQHAAILTPSKGYARTSNARPMSDWKTRPGERAGLNWRLSSLGGAKGRVCLFDPDFWKSFVADRLLTPPAGAGCMTLFGDQIAVHEMLAAHLTAEYGASQPYRGGTFVKWQSRPGRPDNHWLDCAVGATVAASVDGLEWTDSTSSDAATKKPRKKIDIEELYKRANPGEAW